MAGNKKGLEIERKFLIQMISAEELIRQTAGYLTVSKIEQVYLISQDCERRVRSLATVNIADIINQRYGCLACSKRERLSEIVQAYEQTIERLIAEGKAEHVYTEKSRVTDMTRGESEKEVTAKEYEAYLLEADKNLKPIKKFRYTFGFYGQIFELDVYEFSKEYATLEIELPSEDTPVELPRFIKVIKEVTGDKAYKNKSLAKTQTLGK